MKSDSQILLSMKNIHLFYGNKEALRGVDFDLFKGEIHALIGAHRAGKSSLVKILSGALRKQSGEIQYAGKKIDYFTPKSAIQHRIGTVYQHLNIIPSLNAMENIFAGQLPRTWYGGIDYADIISKTKALFAELKLDFDFNLPLNRLSLAKQHMVEFARALALDPQLLILDEISSKLTPEEMEKVYGLILALKARGTGIVYISHNIDEIFEFADRVTILKEGHKVDTEQIKDLDRFKLVKLTYSFVLSSEELKRKNQELYHFKKYNENIIKNIPIGVIILDPDDKVYLINFAALKILELEAEYRPEQSFEELLKNKALENKAEILEKVRLQEKCLLEETAFGGNKILKISVLPFKDEDYVFLGTILLVEDISRDHNLKQYMLRTEKISSIAELAAGVAHEINNPLGIVHNYLELLKMRITDPDGKNKLEKIENEINRINKIIGSLLSFSKFNEVPMRNVDLAEIFDEVVLLLEHRIKAKGIEVKHEAGEDRAFILGDEDKLKQLFMNLVMNGIEAVLVGGLIETVFTNNPDQGFVEFAIQDNGCGIPKEILPRIYDPFFSTKVNKKNAGLGLSICQHIVESHGGLMTCQSEPGQFTRFIIRFPLLRA
jgi:two-component system sensor histidine kinase AtoS